MQQSSADQEHTLLLPIVNTESSNKDYCTSLVRLQLMQLLVPVSMRSQVCILVTSACCKSSLRWLGTNLTMH